MITTEYDTDLDAIVELPQRLETSGLGLPTITVVASVCAFVAVVTPLGSAVAGLGAGLVAGA